MNDPVYNDLRELSWQRNLTEAEEAQLQAWLTANPEAREEWEAEAGLNHLLEALPEAPAVSSNFTALVLQAVEREDAAMARSAQRGRRTWWRWLPRTAVAAAVLGLGTFSYQHQVQNNRRVMAQSVTELSQIVVASNPAFMEDFDAIQWLGDLKPKADTELLALME
jgi:anti-sigma factor RsiW